MKPEQERVRNLLIQTVTLLCRNGLQYESQLKIEGLLGVTLDENEVFLININEIQSAANRTQAKHNVSSAINDLMVPNVVGNSQTLQRQKMKQNKQPLHNVRKMKQKGQGGLRDVLHEKSQQEQLQALRQQQMIDEENEEMWDEEEFEYDEETGYYPPQPLNDMTRYENEVIDLIDDDEEEDPTKSLKKKNTPTPSGNDSGVNKKKRPAMPKTPKNVKKSKKNKTDENGDEHVLEEIGGEEKKEMDNLELSLEDLLGKYLPNQEKKGL